VAARAGISRRGSVLMGGNNSTGYYWIVWSGRLVRRAALCGGAGRLRKKNAGRSFLGAGNLLGAARGSSDRSTTIAGSAPVASVARKRIRRRAHDPRWASTASTGDPGSRGGFWLSLGLLDLSARKRGFGRKQRARCALDFSRTAAILAVVGNPFKFSGQMLVLGNGRPPSGIFLRDIPYFIILVCVRPARLAAVAACS